MFCVDIYMYRTSRAPDIRLRQASSCSIPVGVLGVGWKKGGEVTGPLWHSAFAAWQHVQPHFVGEISPQIVTRLPDVSTPHDNVVPHSPPRKYHKRDGIMSSIDKSKMDRFKLETSYGIGSVTHTTHTTDTAIGQRRVPVQTTWTHQKTLGSGGFGVVALQQTEAGELRAVKKIYTGVAKIDFTREIAVMAKVAHVCSQSAGQWLRARTNKPIENN